MNAGMRASRAPNRVSGGLDWKSNSVLHTFSRPPPIRPFRRAMSSARVMRPIDRIVASLEVGSLARGPAGRVYGW